MAVCQPPHLVQCLSSLSQSTVVPEPSPTMTSTQGPEPDATSLPHASPGYDDPGPWAASRPHKAHLGAGFGCSRGAEGVLTPGSMHDKNRFGYKARKETEVSGRDSRASAAGRSLGVRLGLTVTLPECAKGTARADGRGPPHPVVIFINGFQVCTHKEAIRGFT